MGPYKLQLTLYCTTSEYYKRKTLHTVQYSHTRHLHRAGLRCEPVIASDCALSVVRPKPCEIEVMQHRAALLGHRMLQRRLISAAHKHRLPVELHYSPTPNGWKVTMLLEESGLPYNVVPVHLASGDQHTAEFLKLSPNGRMPALSDPNIEGDDATVATTVFESGAIMLHLAEHYKECGRFLPPEERGAAMQWLFWVNAGLGPMAGQYSHFTYYAPQVSPDADHSYSLDRYAREYDRLLSVLDRRLGCTGGFLAGDIYGIADMAAWPWVKPWKRWMQRGSLRDSGYPHAHRWYESIKRRPATARALNVLRSEAVAAQKVREDRAGLSAEGKANMFRRDGRGVASDVSK